MRQIDDLSVYGEALNRRCLSFAPVMFCLNSVITCDVINAGEAILADDS